MFTLVEWEGERTLSVVPSSSVNGGNFKVGDITTVSTSEGKFRGHVVATGMQVKHLLVVVNTAITVGTKEEMMCNIEEEREKEEEIETNKEVEGVIESAEETCEEREARKKVDRENSIEGEKAGSSVPRNPGKKRGIIENCIYMYHVYAYTANTRLVAHVLIVAHLRLNLHPPRLIKYQLSL